MATAKDEPKDDPLVVAPEDGPDHGYIGQVAAGKNRDDYTVAGVTGGTANVADTPKSAAKKPTSTKASETTGTQNS